MTDKTTVSVEVPTWLARELATFLQLMQAAVEGFEGSGPRMVGMQCAVLSAREPGSYLDKSFGVTADERGDPSSTTGAVMLGSLAHVSTASFRVLLLDAKRQGMTLEDLERLQTFFIEKMTGSRGGRAVRHDPPRRRRNEIGEVVCAFASRLTPTPTPKGA